IDVAQRCLLRLQEVQFYQLFTPYDLLPAGFLFGDVPSFSSNEYHFVLSSFVITVADRTRSLWSATDRRSSITPSPPSPENRIRRVSPACDHESVAPAHWRP